MVWSPATNAQESYQGWESTLQHFCAVVGPGKPRLNDSCWTSVAHSFSPTDCELQRLEVFIIPKEPSW